MKGKNIMIILIGLGIFFILLGVFIIVISPRIIGAIITAPDTNKYPRGRDTADCFGDGRFQVVWRHDTERNKEEYKSLDDNEKQTVIVLRVKNYRTKDKNVYVVSEDGKYTILNYETGEHKTFDKWDDIPDMDKPLFKGL